MEIGNNAMEAFCFWKKAILEAPFHFVKNESWYLITKWTVRRTCSYYLASCGTKMAEWNKAWHILELRPKIMSSQWVYHTKWITYVLIL